MPDAAARSRLETTFDDIESVKRACADFRSVYTALRDEVGKVIVGQDEIVGQALVALFADGHILLEGVPGLGKTLLVRTLGEVLTLPFSRIQFTPDLMPADITGTSVVIEDSTTGHREFTFRRGPIFHQLVLADEINRATPKSQAALLEAMQERSVTIAGETHALERPFFVMATQNPIEQEGTYALPEAQLDRFLFKIAVPYTTRDEMNKIVGRTTVTGESRVRAILGATDIIRAQQLARRVVVAEHVQDYAIRLVLSTHPDGVDCPAWAQRYIQIGVSPRGAQALITAAKVMALIDGRYAASVRDIRAVAGPALRHRIIPSFEAEADGVRTDDIVAHLVDAVPRGGRDETTERRSNGTGQAPAARSVIITGSQGANE